MRNGKSARLPEHETTDDWRVKEDRYVKLVRVLRSSKTSMHVISKAHLREVRPWPSNLGSRKGLEDLNQCLDMIEGK
jgi:hypothetical protein